MKAVTLEYKQIKDLLLLGAESKDLTDNGYSSKKVSFVKCNLNKKELFKEVKPSPLPNFQVFNFSDETVGNYKF